MERHLSIHEKNGFEHRQYSVYSSKPKMTRAEINMLVSSMVNQMPWLYKSLEAIDVTYIGKQHSLMKTIQGAAIELETKGSREIPVEKGSVKQDNKGIKRQKQITFDLSENMLKQYYPRPYGNINPFYYKKAWKDIAQFMEKMDLSIDNILYMIQQLK